MSNGPRKLPYRLVLPTVLLLAGCDRLPSDDATLTPVAPTTTLDLGTPARRDARESGASARRAANRPPITIVPASSEDKEWRRSGIDAACVGVHRLVAGTDAPAIAGTGAALIATRAPRFDLVNHTGGSKIVATVIDGSSSGSRSGQALLVGFGLRVYRISFADEGGPSLEATSERLPGHVLAIEARAGRAFVGTSRGLVVLRIKDRERLPIDGMLTGPYVRNIASFGDQLALIALVQRTPDSASDDAEFGERRCSMRSALYFADVSRPGAPRIVSRASAPRDMQLQELSAAGERLFVAAAAYGLLVFDVSNGAEPRPMYTEPTLGGLSDGPAYAWDVIASGPYAIIHRRFEGRGRSECIQVATEDEDGVYRILRSFECLSEHGNHLLAVEGTRVWSLQGLHSTAQTWWHDLETGVQNPLVAQPDRAPYSSYTTDFVVLDRPLFIEARWNAGGSRVLTFVPAGTEPNDKSRASPSTKHVTLERPPGFIFDVDMCSGGIVVLGRPGPDDNAPVRWIAHAQRDLEGSFTVLASDRLELADSSDDIRLACRGDQLATVTTSWWDDPKVRLAMFDVSNPLRPILLGVHEQSAAHCYTAEGMPVANRCGPVKPLGLEWIGDFLRADYVLGTPQWFDTRNPANPTLLDGRPGPFRRSPRLNSGGWWYKGEVVTSHAGYDYVLYPPAWAGQLQALHERHSTLAVFSSNSAGTDAEPIAELPLASAERVEITLVETGGGPEEGSDRGAYLLASSQDPGLYVISIDDPPAPVVVDHLPLPAPVEALAVEGDMVYVADGPAGLLVYRVSTPR